MSFALAFHAVCGMYLHAAISGEGLSRAARRNGEGYLPPAAKRRASAASDFYEGKIMGRPLAPRQGAALSAFVVDFAFRRRREGVAGGKVPQRWVAEAARG